MPPESYSSTNFACTLYCSLMVLKSSGSSAAASSPYPVFALRITAMLSYSTGITLLFES